MSSIALTRSMDKNYAGIFVHGALAMILALVTPFLPFEYLGVPWLILGAAEILFALGARGSGQLPYHAGFGLLYALGGVCSFYDSQVMVGLVPIIAGGVTLFGALHRRYPGWRSFAVNGLLALALGFVLISPFGVLASLWIKAFFTLELFTRGQAWIGLAWRGLRAMVTRRTMARPIGARSVAV